MFVSIFFFIVLPIPDIIFFFFFNDTATTEIYTLSLHDALPIFNPNPGWRPFQRLNRAEYQRTVKDLLGIDVDVTAFLILRSEEHTSELQSLAYLVCRLLLEKKKNTRQ